MAINVIPPLRLTGRIAVNFLKSLNLCIMSIDKCKHYLNKHVFDTILICNEQQLKSWKGELLAHIQFVQDQKIFLAGSTELFLYNIELELINSRL